VTELESEHLTLHFPKRKREVHAVIDGELIELARDVELRILPQALSVILPARHL
jgi:diacylglycerol kinase family enzyme